MHPIFVNFFLHLNWSKYNLSLKFDPPRRIQNFTGINFKVKNVSNINCSQKQAGTELYLPLAYSIILIAIRGGFKIRFKNYNHLLIIANRGVKDLCIHNTILKLPKGPAQYC